MDKGPRLKVSSDRLVKPGIKPATPGLQGERFIHYTTAAPIFRFIFCRHCKGKQKLLKTKNLPKHANYSKTCVKRPISKRLKIGFQVKLSLNAGQKYCRMLQGEHSAILSTFIKLPVVTKTFILSIFEWLFYTGFTVPCIQRIHYCLTF